MNIVERVRRWLDPDHEDPANRELVRQRVNHIAKQAEIEATLSRRIREVHAAEALYAQRIRGPR